MLHPGGGFSAEEHGIVCQAAIPPGFRSWGGWLCGATAGGAHRVTAAVGGALGLLLSLQTQTYKGRCKVMAVHS